MATLTVVQRKSRNGSDKRQLDTLRSLGLRRINHVVEVQDTPQIRGMLHKVRHLVEVVKPAGGADSVGIASSPGGEHRGEANRS